MGDRKQDNLVRRRLWLEQCAWANRRNMTPSELRLWSALSARKLGVQFRREVPLAGRYIVDFCAPRVRLVVEVDGECHAERRCANSFSATYFFWSDVVCGALGATLAAGAQLAWQSVKTAISGERVLHDPPSRTLLPCRHANAGPKSSRRPPRPCLPRYCARERASSR